MAGLSIVYLQRLPVSRRANISSAGAAAEGRVICVSFFMRVVRPLPDYCRPLSNTLGRLRQRFPGHIGKRFALTQKGKLAADVEGDHFTPDQLGDLVQTYFT
jgi:hypothetical protein